MRTGGKKDQQAERPGTQRNMMPNALSGLKGEPGGWKEEMKGQPIRGKVPEIDKGPVSRLLLEQEKKLLKR